MTNKRNSILSVLFSLGTVFTLAACIDSTIIGGNGGNAGPCMTDADCVMGQACVNGMCAPPNPTTCNGMPSPLSCLQVGCAAGQMCVMDPNPNACYPSSCGCDAATGMWVCTADCGPGGYCVQQQQCGMNGACPPNTVCDAAGQCVPACTPSPETCNGVDDDCDGVIDEQEDPANPLCANGAACVMGQCGGGPLMCSTDADCPPNTLCVNGYCGGVACSPEFCNGLDDDCNGIVDDGPGAICADGTICNNGQCGGNPTQCGPNSPPCPMGQVCSPMGVCVPGGNCVPGLEVCNGVDDDCDGAIDEVTPGATLCMNGGVCVNGQCSANAQCGPNTPCPAGQVCTAAGICMPGGNCVPGPEVCNGVDDDCDGAIDEVMPGTTLCMNGGACVNGQCSANAQCGPNTPCPVGQVCTAAGVCMPGGNCVPKTEVCNGIDDDCDGAIDEITPGATLCPNGGLCANGQCSLLMCQVNAQCPAGSACINGICQ